MSCASSPDTRQPAAALLFDAGGVILHPNLAWVAERSHLQGLPLAVEELFLAYYRTIYELDLDTSLARRGVAFVDLATRVWFFTRLLRYAGVAATRADEAGQDIAQQALATFPRESDIYHWAMPGVVPTLQRLRDAGFLLAAASNNDDALEAQLRSVGALHLFGVLKDSGREGVSKPDPELLLRAARDLGAPPSQCVYVGDVDRVDGQAARAAGMRFVLLDPLQQPRPSRPLCIVELEALHQLFVPLAQRSA